MQGECRSPGDASLAVCARVALHHNLASPRVLSRLLCCRRLSLPSTQQSSAVDGADTSTRIAEKIDGTFVLRVKDRLRSSLNREAAYHAIDSSFEAPFISDLLSPNAPRS